MTPRERLADFFEHNEIADIRREGPSIVSLLTELEEIMIDAGLWTHSESEALPLDKAAAKRMEPNTGLSSWSGWRSPAGWGVAKLSAFAVRALIDAEHRFAAVHPKYRGAP